MTTASRFKKFLSNIQLTESQITDAKTKHTNVAETLANAYYEYKSASSNKLLVGSYGKNTAIRPPNDVDMLFYLPSTVYDRFNKSSWLNGRNYQSELLQEIKYYIKQQYGSTTIRGDGQVVVIDFSTFTVEVVPAFRVHDGSTYIPDTNGGGKWKTINPQNELQRLKDSNKLSKGHVIKLIKMIKKWKQNCNVDIKSFIVEIMAIEYIKSYSYLDKDEIYYDVMVRYFFKYLILYAEGNYNYTYPDTGEVVSLNGSAWVSKLKTAHGRAVKACRFEIGDDKNEVKATDEWKKIFGNDFQY